MYSRHLVYIGLIVGGILLAPIVARDMSARNSRATCPYSGAANVSECPARENAAPGVSTLEMMLHHLPLVDLSSAQRVRIAEILLGIQTDLAPMRTRMRDAHRALMTAARAIPPNEDEMRRRTAEIAEIRTGLREYEGRAFRSVREVLTDAQLRELLAPTAEPDSTAAGVAL